MRSSDTFFSARAGAASSLAGRFLGVTRNQIIMRSTRMPAAQSPRPKYMPAAQSKACDRLFALPFLTVGCGIALVVPSLTIACLAAVKISETEIASGVLNASAQMGGVIGVAVFAAMLASDQPATFVAGTHAAVLTATAGLGLSLIQLLRLMKPSHSNPTGE
jgi:hypothetical protein